MRVVGITAEYDPFHNGHKYHLTEARRRSQADFVVVIMSGDFLQRGVPAMLDKWERSRLAVENGADLVLELPFVYACNSADYFACGAMSLLQHLGCVTHVSFGAESENPALLQRIAGLMRDTEKGQKGQVATEDPLIVEEYQRVLRQELDGGASFAMARGKAIEATLGEEAGAAAREPNNILAIEYLKHGQGLIPVPITRRTPYHDQGELVENKKNPAATNPWERNYIHEYESTCGAMYQEEDGNFWGSVYYGVDSNGVGSSDGEEEAFVSAEAIRHACFAGEPASVWEDYVPMNTKEAIVQSSHLAQPNDMLKGCQEKILRANNIELGGIFGVNEGMENRMKKVVRRASTFDDLVSQLKTKRYPYTSICRMLMHTLVGFEKAELKTPLWTDQLYGRILAVGKRGGELLRHIQKSGCATMPLITSIERDMDGSILNYDILAADLYNLYTGRDLYENCDFVRRPYIAIEK